MKTKNFSLFNQCVFRTMAVCMVLLGGTSAVLAGGGGGGGSSYYFQSQVSLEATGAGKVYVKYGSDGEWIENTTGSGIVALENNSAPDHTYYIKAEPTTGNRFINWTSITGWKTSPNANNAQTNGKVTAASTDNAGSSTKMAHATANFSALPIVQVPAMQTYGAPKGYATIATNMEKNTTTSTQEFVIKVSGGLYASDFNATITNNGTGSFSTVTKTLNAAGTQLTLAFTYTSGNADGAILAVLNVTANNGGWNTNEYSIDLTGTVGKAKKPNPLSWGIDENQAIFTTYTRNQYLTITPNPEAITITVIAGDANVVAIVNGGASIRFKKTGDVTLRAEQPASEDYEGATIEREFHVDKREATFDFSQTEFFVNTEYNGVISCPQDVNNNLLALLSYSGADTYLSVDNAGGITTKSKATNSVTLHITFAGNDEWKPIDVTQTIKVRHPLPQPEFCLSSLEDIETRVNDGLFIIKASAIGSISWSSNALQINTPSYDDYTQAVIHFVGVPNRLQFTCGRAAWMVIQESADGVSWTTMKEQSSVSNGASIDLPFSNSNSRYLKLMVSKYQRNDATSNFPVQNLCITGQSSFAASPTTVEVVTDGETSTPATITIQHNDMTNITVSSDNAKLQTSAFTTTSGSAIGSGNKGTVTFNVDYIVPDVNPTPGTAHLTLTGTKGSGGTMTQTINVNIVVQHATHYAMARAEVASETGSGMVYVAKTDVEPASNQYRLVSEVQDWCSGEYGADDNLVFRYWARPAAGYAFDGWYGIYADGELSALISTDEHYNLSLTADSKDPSHPTIGTLYANFVEDDAAAAPVYALEDLDLGSVVSGEGGLEGNLYLLPEGDNVRPLYIDKTRTTIALTDVAGHEGEAALFSAGEYGSGSKSFHITFTPTGVNPTTHTYQARATVTATNIDPETGEERTPTVHSVIVSATVTPAALATFTVEASHTFADKQRNQTDTWNAVLSNITNAVGNPTITIVGSEYFSVGAYDEVNHRFPITFAPTAVGGPYNATATVSIKNYDEVVTPHTITLTGTCVAAPLATYDVHNSEGQSVVNSTGVYFGDFTPGDAAMRTLYIVDLQNMKEAAIPSITIIPEGMFSSAAYNATTQSFDVTFTAEESEQTVQNAVATIMVLNNDEQLTMKNVPLSAFLVKQADYDVRVTNSEGQLIEGGETNWESGLALANANANSTLTLMRNIDLTETYGITSTQAITQTFTLDLNGKTLSAAIGGSILNPKTAGKTLTIKDSKMGGKIQNIFERNGEVYGINVSAGTLTIKSGTIYAENLKQYSYGNSTAGGTSTNAESMKVYGVYQAAGTTVNISGGKIEAHGTRNVHAIYQASSKANNTALNITGGEIYAEAPAYVYGVYAYGKVNMAGGVLNVKVNDAATNSNTTFMNYYINNNDINRNQVLHRHGYGILMNAYANKVASECYYGTLNITGGTINVNNINKTLSANGTSLWNEHTYGVQMYISRAGMGTSTHDAEDGTNVQKASAIGSIRNATINVTHAGVLSYGVYVLGAYNSFNNTTTPFQISNSEINVTGWQTVYGALADVSIDWSNDVTTYTGTGGCSAGEIVLTDVTVNATTTGGTSAYGAYASATYATIADAKTTTGSQSTGNATYKGEYAIAGKLTINGGTYTANAAKSTAYAVGTATRSKNIRSIKGAVKDRDASTDALGSLGGAAEAYPELTIHDGTFTAITGESTARAVRSGGYTTIDGGTFTATAGTSSAVVIEVTAGRTTVSGVSLTASAKTDANGAYCPATVDTYSLYAYAGEIELNNCNVTVNTTETTNARGVYVTSTVRTYTLSDFNTAKNANNSTYKSYGDYWQIGSRAIGGRATINGGTYTINAQTTTAYGIHIPAESVSADMTENAAGEATVKNATFTVKTNEGTTAYGVYSGGNITIDGCKFTVIPKTTTAKGVYQYSNKATITNTTFDVRATSEARLFYADAQIGSTTGWDYHGEFELGAGNVCTAQSTGGNTAHILTLIANKRNIASGVFAGDYANASHAYVSGGSYKATATGTTTYALNLSANQVQGSATAAPTCIIDGGKFWTKADGGTQAVCSGNSVPGNILIRGGIYNINTNLSTNLASGYDEVPIQSGRAEYSEGYRYEVLPAGPHGTYVCQVGSTKYRTLEEALQVVNNQVIYMIADYTLPAGDYVLPSGSTLLIPYKDGTGKGASTAIGNSAETTTSGTTPYRFRKLTFASGANLTCLGTIETSAQQKANGQYAACVGMPSGAYGQIHLEEGSHISLENGARLNCWGYITGKGTINVKNGATTLEGFQLGDWCGGTNASNLIGNSQKVFPVTHYFYQSIECPITYRPGSTALGSTHINVSILGVQGQDGIKLVGTSGAMFLMNNENASADTWVMKDYDETTDQCVWTLNSGASVGNLNIKISSYSMASGDYDLPITTNMSIVMNYGTMNISQNAVFLPGSQLIVNKEGTLDINGVNIVAYDSEDWTGTTRYYATYSPSWGTNNPRKNIAARDADVFIHGNVSIRNNGGLYTSAGGANVHSTNKDAGEVTYITAAQGNKTNYFLVQGGTTKTALTVNPAKLKNGVDDPAFSASAGTVAGKTWVYYDNMWQCWEQDDRCRYEDAEGEKYAKPNKYVAISSRKSDENGNKIYYDAETYDEDNEQGTRIFVWDENCYWWEVETTPTAEGYYHSIIPDHNGKYNYYEYDDEETYWVIKNVKVTFNGEGVTSTEYTTGYGTKPKWLGATPIKSGYVWDGWQINGAGTVYANDDLPVVTANTTFTSHFTAKVVQYNVTFKNDDGKVLDSRNWVAGSTPSYSGTPEKEATVSQEFIFNGNWSPAITTVSAAAEYTAQYNPTTRQYEVKFLDYDNTELEAPKNVGYGTVPTFTGTPSTPERIDPTDTYIYEFSNWKNQQKGTIGLSAVDGDQTYVAQYTHRPKWFNIRFADYNGTTLQTGNVLTGTMPTAPENPTRESDVQYTYEFTGWSSAITNATENKTYTAQYSSTLRSYTIRFINGDDVLQEGKVYYGETPSYGGVTPTKEGQEFIGWDDVMRTVSGDKDYHAQFDTKRYTFSVVSNDATYGSVVPNVVIQIPHGSAVSVNENSFTVDGQTVTATPTPSTPQYTYSFVQWSNLPAVIEDDIDNVTAVFSRTLNQYTITWKSENGESTLETDANQNFGTATSYNGSTPTKAATAQYTYTFDGWATEASGEKVYNNGSTPNVNGEATYYAHFSSAVNEYTITWVDGNGETLKTEQVAYGQTPAYTGATPTKSATAQYTYTFNNTWSPTITSVTGEATYTAQFGSTVNSYEITWLNDDNSLIDKTTVEYGVVPTHADATKDATAEWSYTFTGWDNTPVAVTGAATYKATFSSSKNSYEITWLNDDNSLIDKTTVEYGVVPTHADATKANTAEYTYTFTGWDNTPVAVTGAATYKATFSSAKNSYEITWLNDDNSLIDKTTVEYGVVPTHADATKAATAEWTYTFTGWDNTPVAVTGAATYKATFSSTKNKYTITWLNADESVLTTTEVEYGQTPTYEGEPEQTGCTFSGWTPALASVTGAATYTATFNCTIIVEDLDVPDTDHTVETNTIATTTTVHVDGTLTIQSGKTLETTDLIIEASADGSGEIDGIEQVTVTGDTYFDLILNTDAWHWSSFGVPFEIDLDEFAPLKDKTTPMTLGTDYDIVYYDALTRAQRGPVHQCWKYVEYQSEHKLIPGVAYLIAFNRPVGHVDVVRFKKASMASINYSEPVEVVATGTGIDDSWNGIANPKIYHALLYAGVTECQVHNGEEIGSDGYTPYIMEDKKFFVGKAAFVQVPPAQSQVIITKADDEAAISIKTSAPRRSREEINDNRYDVQIAPAGSEMADRIYVLADEDKADEYVILSDLAKAGISTKRAQMWVDRYGVKLCKNTTAFIGDRADYPLSIFVPNAGEYTISIAEQPNSESMLYLTYNGRAIWNLSYSDYTGSFEKGTTGQYGLRIVSTRADMPTGIEEMTIENSEAVRKVIIEDKVYIIRNGEIYSITGQKAQ